MRRLRPLAKVCTPFLLFAGCTSVPELPPFTERHPSHPQAQAALVTDRPSILDPTEMDAVAQPDAADTAEMDHSQHQMDMGNEQEEPSAHDDVEGDNGHSEHGGDDDS